MKKIAQVLTFVFAIALLISCGGDTPIPSKIIFKIGPGYTSSNSIVSQGQVITVGLIASKLAADNLLTTFQVSYQYDDNTTPTVFYTENLTGSQVNNLNEDYKITTRSLIGTERWYFSVINKEGVTNSIGLTFVVE